MFSFGQKVISLFQARWRVFEPSGWQPDGSKTRHRAWNTGITLSEAVNIGQALLTCPRRAVMVPPLYRPKLERKCTTKLPSRGAARRLGKCRLRGRAALRSRRTHGKSRSRRNDESVQRRRGRPAREGECRSTAPTTPTARRLAVGLG